MNDAVTPRFALPLIAAGQAGKDLTHNEALATLELAVQPAVVAIGIAVPPADPQPGQSWIVGAAPTGAWAGQAGRLAGWTAGGWRFVAPVPGFAAFNISSGKTVSYRNGAWQEGDIAGSRVTIDGLQVVGARGPAIAAPGGGGTVDAEARATLAAILGALRGHGLIAP